MTTTATTDSPLVAPLLAMLATCKGATFAGFTYTAKASGPRLTDETSRIVVILGGSTEALYQKDVAILQARDVSDLPALDREAHAAVLASRLESLAKGIGNNSQYVHSADNRGGEATYAEVSDLPGVKIHRETGALHIVGLAHSKTVITPGTYRAVKSAPLTVAKDALRATLPSARFRQYKLENVTRAALAGVVLTLD